MEEDVNSSKITLGYLDKAEAVYKVTLLDGTSRSFKPFKGHDGFLRVKMFGKLKVLDAPNILLDIPKCKDEKGKVLKRPSIMKRPSQMPSSQDAVRDELLLCRSCRSSCLRLLLKIGPACCAVKLARKLSGGPLGTRSSCSSLEVLATSLTCCAALAGSAFRS